MGGYAATVWPAYGVVFLVLLVQVILAQKKFYRLRKILMQKYVKSP